MQVMLLVCQTSEKRKEVGSKVSTVAESHIFNRFIELNPYCASEKNYVSPGKGKEPCMLQVIDRHARLKGSYISWKQETALKTTKKINKYLHETNF